MDRTRCGARGQGAAEARLLVAQGAKVVIGDVLDMCGRPVGCKRKIEKSDDQFDSDHVSGLLTRRTGRWPRWCPRSGPKQPGGFESHWRARGFRILGSTDSHLVLLFHPGINAWRG